MTRFYFDLNGEPIKPHETFRSFKDGVRTANHVAPSGGGTPVTRDEYDSLVRRLDTVEALLKGLRTVKPANDVNETINAVNAVNTDVNNTKADRAAYMREYMARKRAEKKAAK